MIPDDALERIRQWAEHKIPEDVRDQVRLELDVTDRTITIQECRPPWHPDMGDQWTRFPVARLRYTKARDQWSLYWRDRNLKFHVRPRRAQQQRPGPPRRGRPRPHSHLLGLTTTMRGSRVPEARP